MGIRKMAQSSGTPPHTRKKGTRVYAGAGKNYMSTVPMMGTNMIMAMGVDR